MYNESHEPVPSITLITDQQIRAYIHPTRMTILAMLAGEKQTVTNVARQLGVHPANITHHFRLLEKAGLILLVEKRETGKNLEKYYRSVAYQFVVSPSEEGPASKQVLALSILRDNLTTAVQALKANKKEDREEPAVLGMLTAARLKPEDLEHFAARLEELRQEFSARQSETGEMYMLNTSLYPGEMAGSGAHEVLIRDKE